MSNEQKTTDRAAQVVSHPAPARPSDPLLEEINVVKLEGWYFCFDRRSIPNRKGTLQFQDGARKLKIELHPDYGQPSVLAYRVLQAAFRKITLEGRPFPETVSFSFRELSRIIGREVWGGKDSQELIKAIRQLQRTIVTLSVDTSDGKERRWVEFSLVSTSGFVSLIDGQADRIKSAVLTLHPLIIDSMRRGHFVVFNWDHITALSPLSAAFYKRLYLHLSNLYENKHDRKSLKFEKDYQAICAEWLGGLQPFAHKSRIEQQLKPHLDALKKTGLLRSFAVERMADGKGYKLSFSPGAGFFADYDLYYHGSSARVLQFQRAADEAQIQAPMELTRYFYQKLHKSEKLDSTIFAEKDIQFAEAMLRRYGMDEGRALVDFTISSAEQTSFAIRNIRAMETYIPAWEANRERREKQTAREKERARKDHDEKQRAAYEAFVREHALSALSTMAADQREALKEEATRNAQQKHGRFGSGMGVTFEERRLVLERHPTLTFEQWQQRQN